VGFIYFIPFFNLQAGLVYSTGRRGSNPQVEGEDVYELLLMKMIMMDSLLSLLYPQGLAERDISIIFRSAVNNGKPSLNSHV
jgi:hypothetical protein